jgi:general secretion pathway protein D
MKKIITILFVLGLTLSINAQIDLKDKLRGYVNPEELVTLSENIPFDQAIQVLSKVSEKIAGKRIVLAAGDSLKKPIGVEISNMQYKKALFIIVQYHNLIVQETQTTLIVRKKDETKLNLDAKTYASVTEREVKISAVIFEANLDDMRERGVNWEFLLSQAGISIDPSLITSPVTTSSSTSTTTTSSQFQVSGSTSYNIGKWDGTATGLLKFFETENLGQIIARPIITARNGVLGSTHVGDEFSIKEKDFAGNLVDKFYPTGTIIEATPYIYSEEGLNYVLLKLKVERSSVLSRDATSTDVSKNVVTTDVLLLDGEETAIGGLFQNQEVVIRRGIPFLKDLPWWFLGIRYLTGYDSKEFIKKEIVMLIKVQIVPSLKDRVQKLKEDAALQNIRQENSDAMDKLKKQIQEKETK